MINKMNFKRKNSFSLWENIDKTNLFSIIFLMIFSIIFVYSSSIYDSINNNLESPYNALIKQLLFCFLAIIVYFLTLKVHTKYYFYFCDIFVYCSIFLILMTFIFAQRNGAHRWIELGPLTLQPSELGKMSLIFLWSKYLSKKRKTILANLKIKSNDLLYGIKIIFNNFRFPFLLTILFCFLFRMQSDNGSWIISLSVIFILVFSSGIFSSKLNLYFIIILLSVILILFFLYFYLNSLGKETLETLGNKSGGYNYILGRFIAWINPFLTYSGSGYQIVNSLIAIANGGLIGKGIGNGIQKQGFLTEGYNDFIIANIIEEIGFIGLIVIYYLYMRIIFSGYKIAYRNKNAFEYLLTIGITTMFFIQFFWNNAGIVGLLPMKGLTAPILSYGGTSLIITMFSLGIVQRINIQNKIKNKNKNVKN